MKIGEWIKQKEKGLVNEHKFWRELGEVSRKSYGEWRAMACAEKP